MSEDFKKKQKSIEQKASTRSVLLAEMTRAPQSKTWKWATDPMYLTANDGTQMYKLDTLRFTIFDDGNTRYTLSWNATSLGWQSIRAQGAVTPHIVLSVLNAAEGVLDPWDIGSPDWPCGAQPVVFTNNNGKAGIISLAAIIDLNIGGADWGNC